MEMAVCATYQIPHSQFLDWDQDDRDKAIWFHLRKADTCSGCGTRREEWDSDQNAYVGDIVRCRGCEIRQRTEASIPKDSGRGLQVILRKRRHHG